MNNILRRIMLVITCCLILTALSGCGQSGRQIAFFKYSGVDTFIAEMMDYMTAGVPEGITFEVRDAGNSQSVQNQQIVELIESGSELLVINAVDRLASSAIVARSTADGVPIIFFNREPLEDALIGNDNVFYVGADPDSMGMRQADMVAELFTDNFAGSKFDRNNDGIVQLVILKGEQGHQDAERRTDHSIAHFMELGFEVEVLAIEVADWNRQDGFDAMQSLYERYGESIELVFSNNDDMALGAIDFLLNAGVFREGRAAYDQPFIIVGVDGTAVGLAAIGKGLLYGTVNNDSVRQSDAILTLIDFILHDRNFDDFPFEITRDHYIYIDGDIITLTNITDFIG